MQRLFRMLSLALMLMFLCLPMAQAEILLRTNCVPVNEQSLTRFLELCPDVLVDAEESTFYETAEGLLTAFVTHTFPFDVLSLDTYLDYRPVMKKGYCLDLSSNEVIRSTIEKLYPVYYEQCVSEDGTIYAIPQTVQFNYYTLDTELLAETGFKLEKMPSTFPEFLDFLEAWVEFVQEEPTLTAIQGEMYWGDQAFYTSSSYTSLLVENLLSEYTMQKDWAREPLRFSDPELIALLERCKSVGADLYTYDAGYDGTAFIVNCGAVSSLGGPDSGEILFFRLSEEQPKLIQVVLSLIAAYAGTEHSEETMALMQALLENTADRYRPYFYQDEEPVLDPQYEAGLVGQQRAVEETKQKLAQDDLELSERDELTWQLESQQKLLDNLLYNEEEKYLVSPSRLARYCEYADTLYVLLPGVFNANTEAGKTFRNLQARFSQGQLTAEELVKELDRNAKMDEMEEGE